MPPPPTAIARTARANAGFLTGSILGLSGGVYGAVVGGLLGFMLDTILSERRLRSWLATPALASAAPDELLHGLAAALALASGLGPGLAPGVRRRALEGLLTKAMAGRGRLERLVHRPWPGSVLALLDEEPTIDVAGLARQLALGGSQEAQGFLAEAAWTLEAESTATLSWQRENEITAWLADAGVSPAAILETRGHHYPGWNSPWAVLGLPVGSPPEAVRQAWRTLSMRWHPDRAAPEDGTERFREAQEAYEALTGFGPRDPRA